MFTVRSVILKPPWGAENCVGASMSKDLCNGRSSVLSSVFMAAEDAEWATKMCDTL